MYKILLGVTFMGCLLFSACQQKQAPETPPVQVNLYTAKAAPVVFYDRYTSTTAALSQVNLLPQVQGYVTGIYFREGAHVKKGQKLYEIDRRIYEGNYQVAEANMKVAEGTLKQAQQDADRYSYLNSEKAVAKQLYDHALITLENSENAYKAAAESLRNAKTSMSYSVITAPFDGTIGFSQVKLGDLVNVGQTVLNTISSDDPMAVDFLINEKQLTRFEKIASAKNTIDSLFTLQLPDNSYYDFTGQLSVIDRAVNSQTGSVRVRLVFPNTKYYLRAGMSCVVRVRNQDTTPQLLIPNKAVVEQMGEFFVYVARDTLISKPADSSSKDHKAETYHGLVAMQKKVKTGETIGADIIVRSGIEEGEKIVVDGIQSLHDGSHIVLSKATSGTAADGKGGSGKKGQHGGQ